MTESNYSLFRSRMSAKGTTLRDRRFKAKQLSFQRWFDNTLARELVEIDGVSQDVVINDKDMGNSGDLSDDKYIITKNESNLEVGSIVRWKEKLWLVFSEEYKTIATHKQGRMKETNGRFKWMIGSEVCGNGEGHPAYIKNQTLYTLGVDTSGSHAWVVDSQMTVYMKKNEETENIKVGQRFFIGNVVYQVMFKDSVSRQGIINCLMEQDFLDPQRDNVELLIADYYTNSNSDTSQTEETPIEEITEKVIQITGSDNMRAGSTLQFDAKVFENGVELEEGISEWTVLDLEGSVRIVEHSDRYVKIKSEFDFNFVGANFTILAKTLDETTGTKTVNIISPY